MFHRIQYAAQQLLQHSSEGNGFPFLLIDVDDHLPMCGILKKQPGTWQGDKLVNISLSRNSTVYDLTHSYMCEMNNLYISRSLVQY